MRWTVALLLIVPSLAWSQEVTSTVETPPNSPSPTQEADLCWDWLAGQPCYPVTHGNPNLNPDLWQRTWGIVGFNAIPIGDKMAPNGVPYDPLFSLDLLLNIALTRDRRWYVYLESCFWGQKPGEGLTNSRQGVFDFSKRQFDIDAGIAWNFYGRMEARAFFYSLNNLNRGENLWQPRGFKDGFAVECRYYFPTTDFDRGLYRFVSIGYMPTKDLVGADGGAFKPSFFATASLAYDFLPECFYAYADLEYITERDFKPKLFIVDPGIAFRPFRSCNDLEFRLGIENTIDVDLAFTRSLLYCSARIVW